MTSAAPAIEVRNLVARYGGRTVLDDVSVTLPERETLVVLGPSGCGKSTLLRCLVGLLPPSSGSVRILGSDIAELDDDALDALRRKIGVGFQSSALLNSLTVGENVSLPLREHTRLDPATIRIMTRLKLEQVGLGGLEDHVPSELSGGMRKRAGIARAIAMDPRCLFLDEPSAGLDPITAAGLDELLVRLRRAMGLTLVVVTHEMDSAARLASRVLLLDRGAVRLSGTLEDLRASVDPRVRQFLDRRPDPEPTDSARLVNELTR
jgi:phospholipid/cholesterol/gamma-HCH transport system ATP-binding protein